MEIVMKRRRIPANTTITDNIAFNALSTDQHPPFPSISYQFFFEIENLVLWARSEIIGFTIDQLYSWVSGVRFQVSVDTEP